ncbi:YkgJ family cysteine cluster protein [Myxococcota bacterium]|nr:YkgJ family cysteine cluster protein [Myxococcota bacterium]
MAAYQDLLDKVDAFSAHAVEGQGPYLRCARGCDQCCRQPRTVFAVELAHLRAWIADHPEAVIGLPVADEGPRCPMLKADGACAVYPARPIICRTHGPAARVDEALSYCALNFEGLSASAIEGLIPASSVLNLGLLNTLLVLLNQQHLATHPGPARADIGEALEP